MWGKTAEIAEKFLRKGQEVARIDIHLAVGRGRGGVARTVSFRSSARVYGPAGIQGAHHGCHAGLQFVHHRDAACGADIAGREAAAPRHAAARAAQPAAADDDGIPVVSHDRHRLRAVDVDPGIRVRNLIKNDEDNRQLRL